MLAGLESPDTGTIHLGGEEVTDRPARGRDTNLVFQDLVLFPHMTVAENVGYGPARRGVPAEERAERVAELLGLIGLPDAGDRDPTELSGGQRQRVALARALANRPSVLLLDEPLSSLDRRLRDGMQAELKRIQREVGTTFLYVTHDQESAMSMSDRVAVMNEGRVVEAGTPEELYARPETPFVAEFLGDANTLRLPVTGVGDDVVTLRLGGDGGATLEATTETTRRPAVGDRVTAVVRPETVTVGEGPFTGRVVDAAYKGFYRDYTVELPDGERLRVRSRDDERYTPGESLRFAVGTARLVAEDGR
jgi:spermidine/putrescine transport system ATP-binding protein